MGEAKFVEDLKDVNVLVDGYNLQLRQGTGLKSYGTSLVQALGRLGARVDILYSRNSSEDPFLNEVLFFDLVQDIPVLLQDKPDHQLLTRHKIYHSMIAAREISKTALFPNPKPFHLDHKCIKPAELQWQSGKTIYNLSYCYQTAKITRRLLGVPLKLRMGGKVDVWHATFPMPIRVRKARTVTTIADLIPLRVPFATVDDKRAIYRNAQDAVKFSDVIITLSENSKNDIVELLGASPEKICVTHLPAFFTESPPDGRLARRTLSSFGLETGRYILYVGTIEPRKNVGRLIDAYASIDCDVPLILVGHKGWLHTLELRKAEFLMEKGRLKLLNYVPKEELQALYAGAAFFVFPSLYEGFGLPPLEAMQFGCPVITSNVSSLPEVCGDAALYVDPYDVGDIRAKMETLLSDGPDGKIRKELNARAKERLHLFSPDRYMENLYRAYEKIL